MYKKNNQKEKYTFVITSEIEVFIQSLLENTLKNKKNSLGEAVRKALHYLYAQHPVLSKVQNTKVKYPDNYLCACRLQCGWSFFKLLNKLKLPKSNLAFIACHLQKLALSQNAWGLNYTKYKKTLAFVEISVKHWQS